MEIETALFSQTHSTEIKFDQNSADKNIFKIDLAKTKGKCAEKIEFSIIWAQKIEFSPC